MLCLPLEHPKGYKIRHEPERLVVILQGMPVTLCQYFEGFKLRDGVFNRDAHPPLLLVLDLLRAIEQRELGKSRVTSVAGSVVLP